MTQTPVPHAAFATRHIGLTEADITTMLATVNSSSLDDLLDSVIPAKIRRKSEMDLPPPIQNIRHWLLYAVWQTEMTLSHH